MTIRHHDSIYEKTAEKTAKKTAKDISDSHDSIYEKMAKDISDSHEISEDEKARLLKNITKLKDNKLNLMIVGATGVGKSSTINALFGEEVSTVGTTPDPETSKIGKYDLGNLILWDTPGLGDSGKADERYKELIQEKLAEKDEQGKPLIDLVLVLIASGGSKDLNTTFELINKTIIPALGGKNEKCENRILVAINKCDLAMSGKGWNSEKNCPGPKLESFLKALVVSIHDRIKRDTEVDIEPIYYSAGFKDEDEEQKPYNLSKLLYFIIKYTPKEKRMIYVDRINPDKTTRRNDDGGNYNKMSAELLWESVRDGAFEGAGTGAAIGENIFGAPGRVIGGAVGGFVGAVGGLFGRLFGR